MAQIQVKILPVTTELSIQAAADQAADWLHRRLENNWFDEKERPERAAAYAALAAADRLDIASLHYFADTSADKSLPPLAAAQLALNTKLNATDIQNLKLLIGV